jgi:hypothetical protein
MKNPFSLRKPEFAEKVALGMSDRICSSQRDLIDYLQKVLENPDKDSNLKDKKEYKSAFTEADRIGLFLDSFPSHVFACISFLFFIFVY